MYPGGAPWFGVRMLLRARHDIRVLLAIAACALLGGLGACGSSDDTTDGAAPAAGAAETAAEEGDGATDSDTDAEAASESEPESAAAPTGPSAGLQLDDGWPEGVWIPTDVTVYGGSFSDMGDGTYAAQAFGHTDMSVEELRAAIKAGNGNPAEERDHPRGSFVMGYPDLLAGNSIGFELIDEGADGRTALIVRIAPK
mgnify:CR=1 FL=1